MFELLCAAVLIGAAIVWVTELINSAVYRWISKLVVNRILTVPLATFGGYSLGYQDHELFVLVPASVFSALIVIRWLDKPTVINRSGRY